MHAYIYGKRMRKWEGPDYFQRNRFRTLLSLWPAVKGAEPETRRHRQFGRASAVGKGRLEIPESKPLAPLSASAFLFTGGRVPGERRGTATDVWVPL